MAVAKSKFLGFVASLPYAEPDAMLAHFWGDLVDCARQVEALLEHPLNIDGKRHYLPNLKGENDRRQYYIADLRRDDDGTVWPAVTFGSFKSRLDNVFFKPRDLCWRSFELNSHGAVIDLDAKREYKRRNADWIKKHQEMQAEVARNEREGHEAATVAARLAWQAAQAVTETAAHGYLQGKGLQPMGEVRIATQTITHRLYSKSDREWYEQATVCKPGDLLVPLYSPDPLTKGLCNLQRIFRDPKVQDRYVKRFILGGKTQHCYCPIASSTGEVSAYLTAEGYATGASLAMAVRGQPYGVAVAFSLGNVPSVTQMLLEKYPNKPVINAADNDYDTEGNPGLKVAERLLKEPPHVPYILPSWPDTPRSCDWDDLRQAYGVEALSGLVGGKIAEAMQAWRRYHESAGQEDKKKTAPPLVPASDDDADATLAYGVLVDEKGSDLIAQSFAATLVARAMRGKFAFEPDSGRWFSFADTHWQYDESEKETKRAVAMHLVQGAGDVGFSLRYAESVRRLQQDMLLLPLPERPKNSIPFRNGLLSLDTMQLQPITPDNAHDWALPHDYDPFAKCPQVLAWLTRSLDNCDHSVELVRAFWAAALRGIYLQKFVVLKGPARTGKGTFQRYLEEMLGAHNVAVTDLEMLETNRFETASLYRKRLCMISEAGKYAGSLNVLKKITGADAVRLEFKSKQQGRFTFDGLVLLVTNEDLRSTDLAGIERRRVTLSFNKQATQEELLHWQPYGGIEAVLRKELPGAINWALSMPEHEIYDIFERLPDRIRTENARAMGVGSSVADFALAHCQFNAAADERGRMAQFAYVGTKKERTIEGAKIYEGSGEALYPSYLTYCDRVNRKPVALNEFRRALGELARLDGVELEDGKHPDNRRSVLRGVSFTFPDHD